MRWTRSHWSLVLILGSIGMSAGCGKSSSPVHTVTYEVLTPDGTPLFARGEMDLDWMRPIAHDRVTGHVRLLVYGGASGKPWIEMEAPRQAEDVVLWVAGCRDLPLPSSPASAPLQLEYGPRVLLHLTSDGALPAPPLELELTFTPRGSGRAPDAVLRHEVPAAAPERSASAQDANGRASHRIVFAGTSHMDVHFGRPGPYRVGWTLRRVQRVTGGTVSSGIGDPAYGLVIEVKEGLEEQTIEIPISGRTLRRLELSLGQ